MTADAICPDCGSPLAANQPRALCPHCALGGLLTEDETSPASPITAGLDPASQSEAAEFTRRSFGDYELLEEIARGGMGVVYKARQKSLGRIVAVKMLLIGTHVNPDFIKRFRIEAEAAAGLQHPNIVAIHEVGVFEGEHFLVMDYIEGSNLARLAREQTLSAKRAAQFLKIIAEAIHYAHERGILHRDLKPSNVLIDAKDQPLVTDFGLAKRLTGPQLKDASQLTQSGHVLGSPSYMPPEQASGTRAAVSRRSDVYSMGAMLYHLLAGRPPFGGGSVTDTLKQVETQEPVSPRLLNLSVPRDLETICLKCLEKDPARRYPTALELAEELGRFLKDEPIHARPVGRVEKAWRWGRRNPLAASFVATVCVALVSSVSLLYLVNQEKNKQMELTKEKAGINRDLMASSKRIMMLHEESLEGIWGNREKRSMALVSEDIASLAALPVVPVSNHAALVRWTMGLITDEHPAERMRQHAMLLSELESRISQSLGREVRVNVKLYKFSEDMVADLCAGKIDFTRLGALTYLRIRRTHPAVVPLVMPTAFYKVGLLFTRTNSDVRSLGEVRGHAVAFGDTNSTISYWAQIKLAEQGVTATNLSRHDFLDSTLDFADEVLEAGYSNAVSRIGYLHSHAQVIEGVLDGRYDVGVAMQKAFEIHKARGLAAIPGSEFQSSRNIWVARPGLDPGFARAMVSTMTNLQGHWLETLPDKSTGYEAVSTNVYPVEVRWLDRIESLFPIKPSTPDK